MTAKIEAEMNWRSLGEEHGVKQYRLTLATLETDLFLRVQKKQMGYEASLGYSNRTIAKWETGRHLEVTTHPETKIITHIAEKTLPQAKGAATRFVLEHRSYIQMLYIEEIRYQQSVLDAMFAANDYKGLFFGRMSGEDYTPDNYRQGIWVNRLEDAPAGLREFTRSKRRSF